MDEPTIETLLEREVEQLSRKIDLGAKLDKISNDINEIKIVMARQDGQNIPVRLTAVEVEIGKMKEYAAERAWISEQVENNMEDIEALKVWRWTLVGAFILASILLPVAIKIFS